MMKKTLVAVAISLMAASTALVAAPWHHPQARPEVRMQIDTGAVQANLQDTYAALAGELNLTDKNKAAYDNYVKVRVQAAVDHATWHNQAVPGEPGRQARLERRAEHDQLRAKTSAALAKARADLIKTMTPEQVKALDEQEPAFRRDRRMGPGQDRPCDTGRRPCETGFGGPGMAAPGASGPCPMRSPGPGYWHGHRHGDGDGYGWGMRGHRGPGCGW